MRFETPANLEAITNEADFQTLVVDALRHMGWVVIHIKEMFGNPKGVPDLLCFRRGQGEMIELKVGKNTLSAGQKAWQARWLTEDTRVTVIKNTDAGWRLLMERME